MLSGIINWKRMGCEKRERLPMEMKGNEKKYINVLKGRKKYSQRARNTRLKEAENMKSDLMEIDVCFGIGKKDYPRILQSE